MQDKAAHIALGPGLMAIVANQEQATDIVAGLYAIAGRRRDLNPARSQRCRDLAERIEQGRAAAREEEAAGA